MIHGLPLGSLRAAQNEMVTGTCATPRGELVIDHFQGKGVFFVRGLLCDRCNSVMQRHDGAAPWGPASRPFESRARAYHLNAFGRPSEQLLARADELIRLRIARRGVPARLTNSPSAQDS